MTQHIPPQPYHTYLVVDFEQAQAKSFMDVFGSHPMGYFFHYRQYLYRKLQKFEDLNELYIKDYKQKAIIAFNCFAALALVR